VSRRLPEAAADWHLYATGRDVERLEERLLKLEQRLNLLFGALIVVVAMVNIAAVVIIGPIIASVLRAQGP
jgi:hypothetical protein